MENNNDSGFKFSIEDERPNSLLQAKKKEPVWKENRRFETLSRRITLISFLMLCLLGVIVFAAYIHIEERLDNINSAENEEFQGFSQNLESQISSLSSRYAKMEESLIKLEESLAEKISRMDDFLSEFENTTASIEAHLKNLDKNLDKIRSSKADKKELTDAVARMGETLTPLFRELENIRSSDVGDKISSLDEKYTEELTKLSGIIDETKEEFKNLRADIASMTTDNTKEKLSKLETEILKLSTDKVGKELIDIALEDQKKRYKENLILINENLGYKDDKIKSVQKKLEEIEKLLKSAKKKKYRKSVKASPSKQPVPKSRPVKKLPVPKSGDIIERNIE